MRVTLTLLALFTHLALFATAPWSGRPGLFLALCAACALVSGATALLARRWPNDRLTWIAVLGVTAALHALWLTHPPILSEDVYRYAFEGELVRAGVSPYEHAPLDDAVLPYRDEEVWPRIGHPELATVYPPLSILSFTAAGLFGRLAGVRVAFALASLAVTALLLWTLRRRGLPPARAAAYGWSPLPMLEFANAGHHDALGVLLLVAAFAALTAGRPMRSALGWAAAAGVKGLSLVTYPALWRAWSWPARGVAIAVAVALLAPLLWLSSGESSGVGAYALRWQHNDVGYAYLAKWFPDGEDARRTAAAVAVTLAVVLAVLRRPAAMTSVWILVAVLFVSPTVHPWYAAWPLALAALAASPSGWLLGQLVLVSYAVPGLQSDPGFAFIPMPWRWAQWIAPLALLVWEIARSRREERMT